MTGRRGEARHVLHRAATDDDTERLPIDAEARPLALDPRLAGEGRAFDGEREMAFAGGVVAAVAAVLLARTIRRAR